MIVIVLQWMKLCSTFTEENYGIKIIFDEIDTPHAHISFSIIVITHSVY